MITNKLKVISFIMTVLLASTLFFGCAKKSDDKSPSLKNASEPVLPVKEPVTLKYWCSVNNDSIKNNNEMRLYQELERITGIKIDFIHPGANQGSEQLNIMLASGEYPDLIEGINSYRGGFIKAYQDEIILKLNELQKEYAPNLMKLYEKYPMLAIEAQDDQGNFYAVPMIRGGNIMRTYNGPIMRKDWLNELSLDVPETIDEWYNVLSQFKSKKGVDAPLSTMLSNLRTPTFTGAFGIIDDYFIENGKVVYGPYDNRYKDYMEVMAKWYKNGLIDGETAMLTRRTVDAKVLGSQTGATVVGIGGGIGGYITQMNGVDSEFDIVAVPYPVLEKGDIAYMLQRDPNVQLNLGVCLTTANKNPVESMAWVDYAFSKEGHLLFNFGIENESYTMVDGYPEFTDLIMNNPEGLTMSKIGGQYARSFSAGPFVQDTKYGEQFYSMPQQKEASETWTKSIDAYNKKNYRLVGTLTPEETEEIASKQNEINTYINEIYVKWLMGQQSLDNFDEYLQRLQKMGIEDIINVKQKAYERFITKFPEAKVRTEFDPSQLYWEE